MRSANIVLALSAFASLASAASLGKRQYPACVTTCIGTEAGAVGCSLSDAPCLCKSKAFVNQVAVCFANSCSAADASAGVALGQELCKAVGLPVSIPSVAASALSSGADNSGAPAATNSPAPASAESSPASQSPAPASSAPSEPAASSAPPASSAAAPPASSAPPPTGAAVALNGNMALAGLTILGAIMTLAA